MKNWSLEKIIVIALVLSLTLFGAWAASKLFDVSINDIILYILLLDYAKRIYQEIKDEIDDEQ